MGAESATAEGGPETAARGIRNRPAAIEPPGKPITRRRPSPRTVLAIASLGAAVAFVDATIVNIAFMNNFGVEEETRRQAEESRTLQWMTISQRLGARFLRTFAGWPEGDRGARWPGMISALRSVCSAAERRGVRLVMENHNHRGFVQTSADVTDILDAVRSPALGLLLDTGNYLDGLSSIARTAALAWHAHAKFTRVGADGRDPSVDHDAIVPLLRAAGYSGWVSVEYEGAEPSRTAVPRALAYLRQAIGP